MPCIQINWCLRHRNAQTARQKCCADHYLGLWISYRMHKLCLSIMLGALEQHCKTQGKLWRPESCRYQGSEGMDSTSTYCSRQRTDLLQSYASFFLLGCSVLLELQLGCLQILGDLSIIRLVNAFSLIAGHSTRLLMCDWHCIAFDEVLVHLFWQHRGSHVQQRLPHSFWALQSAVICITSWLECLRSSCECIQQIRWIDMVVVVVFCLTFCLGLREKATNLVQSEACLIPTVQL